MCVNQILKAKMINPIIIVLSHSQSLDVSVYNKILSLHLSLHPPHSHNHTYSCTFVLWIFFAFLPFVIRNFRLVGKNICKRCNHILFRNVCELWAVVVVVVVFHSILLLYYNAFLSKCVFFSSNSILVVVWWKGRKAKTTQRHTYTNTQIEITRNVDRDTQSRTNKVSIAFFFHFGALTSYLSCIFIKKELSTRKVNWIFFDVDLK